MLRALFFCSAPIAVVSCFQSLSPSCLPTHSFQPVHGKMSTPVTNSTSACPTFLEQPQNVSSPYCALASCAGNAAAMSLCCAGSEVVPYHFISGFPNASTNETSGSALWCHVSNNSTMDWDLCVSQHGATGGLCDPGDTVVKSGANSRNGLGYDGIAGFFGIVVLLHALF
jgi:hypothetical protein